MSHVDIVRAWKDPEYRQNLSEADLKKMPAHPAGLIELKDAELEAVAGGDCCKKTCRIHNCLYA
jgi:mersacidin/lichenicidin family type 2 lantibiotic